MFAFSYFSSPFGLSLVYSNVFVGIILTILHDNVFRCFFSLHILVGFKSSEIFQKIWNSIHSGQTGAGVLADGS